MRYKKARNKDLSKCTTLELMDEIKARVRLTGLHGPKTMIAEVIKVVSEITEVTVPQIMCGSRRHRHVVARALTAHFLYDYLELSLEECAKAVGRNCHTSALYLRNLTRAAIANNEKPQYEYFQLILIRLIEEGILVSKDSGKRYG